MKFKVKPPNYPEIVLLERGNDGDIYELRNAEPIVQPDDLPVHIHLPGESDWTRTVGVGMRGFDRPNEMVVTVHVGGKVCEISPDEARELARRLIDAAEPRKLSWK